MNNKEKYLKILELCKIAEDKLLAYYVKMALKYYPDENNLDSGNNVTITTQQRVGDKIKFIIITKDEVIKIAKNHYETFGEKVVFRYDEIDPHVITVGTLSTPTPIKGYIPGDWEDIIIRWGKKAIQIKKDLEREEREMKEKRFFANFGL